MLALEERVALGLSSQTQQITQSQQQSTSADTLRMWQNLLSGTGPFLSSQQSGINRSTIPTTLSNTTPNPLLNLSSFLGLSNNVQSTSSLFSSINTGFQTNLISGQHPLYQQGMCLWPQCNQVRKRLLFSTLFRLVIPFSRLFNI